MVEAFPRWPWRRWRWRTPRTPQHINNWWRRGKSERNGYERSTNHNQRSRWWCWHIDWFMPWNLWKNNSWLSLHDNAPAHTSLLVREFLAKKNTVTMSQPQYSPDIAPCDFFLFTKIKRTLKGRRFTAIDEIKSASLKELFQRSSLRSVSRIGKSSGTSA